MITVDRLRSLLDYDPATGIFLWKAQRNHNARIKAGDRAGGLDATKRYLIIQIDGKQYKAHRLAWLYVHGHFPSDQMDHQNRDGLDNRIVNLRECDASENCRNKGTRSSTGVKGVHAFKNCHKFRAMVGHRNQKYDLGLFATIAEAADAVRAKRAELHGAFANHG